ncbi:MAG: hypothetical protein O2819_03900 [Planctomycetota bacterium]|nr:hypothetical protein [Planctomycetota bacterium]MDA1106629.1 hypothetical protein [Planctomycetota bacterium]
MRLANFATAILACLPWVTVIGCSAPQPAPGPVEAPNYARAWSATLEVLRDNGYRPVIVDEAQGFIETAPMREGSWLDPWNIAPHQRALEVSEALTAQQRRVVRVRFLPRDAEEAVLLPSIDGPLGGPIPPGGTRQPQPLSSSPEQAVLVLWTTVIERKSQANQNPDAWSGALETSWKSEVVVQEAPAPGMPPIVRDTDQWVPTRTDSEESTRLGRALVEKLARAALVATSLAPKPVPGPAESSP